MTMKADDWGEAYNDEPGPNHSMPAGGRAGAVDLDEVWVSSTSTMVRKTSMNGTFDRQRVAIIRAKAEDSIMRSDEVQRPVTNIIDAEFD